MKQILSLQESEDEEKVGSKASSLAKVSEVVRIPEGFVVSNDAFRRFLEENEAKDKILSILARTQIEDKSQVEEASRKIRGLFENARISEELKEKVAEAYKDFVISSEAKKAGEKAMELIKAGRDKPFVAVRASPKRNGNSSAGIYRSKLNVRGDESLIEEIKEVWKSFYRPEAIYYREKRGYGHDVPFGVLVQRMVEPDKTVAFLERNPTNPEEFILEGVYGLGEILSEGQVVPDIYIFEREASQLKEKKVADKEWIQAKNPSTGNIEKQPIQSSKKNSEVLEEREINEIISKAGNVTSRFAFNALVELCKKNNEIFLLDVSPLREGERTYAEKRGKILDEALGVSPGHFSGEITKRNENLGGKVFLTKIPSSKNILFSPPGAVLSSSGGFSSNGARMARELEIPMLVHLDFGKTTFPEGKKVSIDTFKGEIRAEEEGALRESESEPSVESFSDSVTATEVMLSLSPNQLDNLQGENTGSVILNLQTSLSSSRFFEDSTERIIRKSMNLAKEVWIKADPSEDSYRIILETLKEIHRKGKRNAHLLFSLSNIKDLEEKMLELPGSVKKGLVIETPITALSAEQICSRDLDLVLIDLDELVNRMFGLEIKERNIINSPPFWEVMGKLCEKCRESGMNISVTGNLNKRLVKKLVESGIDSILVEPESVKKARRMLARVEKKLLLEKMR